MRLTVKEAKSLGIWHRIPESTRTVIAKDSRLHKKTNINPQQPLYDALILVIPEAQTEVTGLIEGRKFRADIYLPSSGIVIEIDGFKEHAFIKANFHATLDRQNLFVSNGYKVLRYYSKRILRDLNGVIAEILANHHNTTNKQANHP